MILLAVPAFLLSLSSHGPPAPPSVEFDPAREVQVGIDGPAFDACASIARVTGADETVDVMGAPSSTAATTESLPTGSLVWLCESEDEWQGIVYPGKGQDTGDCRVSSPAANSEPYSGPCKSGWMPGRNIVIVAG